MRSVASPSTTMASASRSAWTTSRLLRMIAVCSDARRPLAPHEQKRRLGGVRAGEQGAEVGVGADEHPALGAGRVDNYVVGRAARAASRMCITSWLALRRFRRAWGRGCCRGRTSCRVPQRQFALADGLGGVAQRLGRLLGGEVGQFAGDLDGHAVGHHRYDGCDRDAQAPDGGHAAHRVRVHSDQHERQEVSASVSTPR
jgi:hypothetical protein